ncbi:hypothetical protein [Psychrobacillus sp. NPDC096623]|uniref:hypothetical protein n=1 Tax=Psychrobacillus sp. NPDC096623 TaxID=3364492 RepID=UPI00380B4CFE
MSSIIALIPVLIFFVFWIFVIWFLLTLVKSSNERNMLLREISRKLDGLQNNNNIN